jgi:hypothetical protein
VLLSRLVNATTGVAEALDRPEYRIEKSALPGKDSDHVRTQWFGNCDQHQEEDHNLKDTIVCHNGLRISPVLTGRKSSTGIEKAQRYLQ